MEDRVIHAFPRAEAYEVTEMNSDKTIKRKESKTNQKTLIRSTSGLCQRVEAFKLAEIISRGHANQGMTVITKDRDIP